MLSGRVTILWGCVLLAGLQRVAGHDDQKYNKGEPIPLFVDTVVPYDNPQESYRYYSLPMCTPEEMHHKAQTLGEVLQGSEKMYSPYGIHFATDTPVTELCRRRLKSQDVAKLRYAIQNQYYFTWYFDEIPIKEKIGEMDQSGVCTLFTQHDFKLQFNGDRVIEAKLVQDPGHRMRLPEDNHEVDMMVSYTVQWTETNVAFEDRRANNDQEYVPDEIEIQWFSIVNSSVLVILLTGFVSYIVMRVLKKDYQRLASFDDDDVEETGWKLVHEDVFRTPSYPALFASIVGVGFQLLLIFVIMLTLSVIGVFHQYGRGTMYAAIIVVYSLTTVIAGYTSAAFYKTLDGGNWVHNVLTTVTLFAVPVFLVWALLNTVAIVYGSTVALPFGTIVALFALYFLVTFPLTLAGAIAGKTYGPPLDAPKRTRKAPREVPPSPFYRGPVVHVIVAGFLPFSAIYVELYYVFLSLWGHQLLTPYGILYLVFVILLAVTACIAVSLTYLQLSVEDHRWWWRSLVSGGATSFFIYTYCLHFLSSESKMSGFMQLSYYFGYMLLICYALFIMLAAIGFWSSWVFVRNLYKSVPID